MIAEQEQLLSKQESMTSKAPPVFVSKTENEAASNALFDATDAINSSEEQELNESAAYAQEENPSEPQPADTQDQQTNNQAESNIEQDDAELLAAMEEEMIAQLQAEQEEIENSSENEAEEKTLSDLANKFD
jgi:hypothetical protein